MITRLKWKHSRNSYIGFTLPELLIALMILGEIATFTIPKILTAQANGQNNAVAHEDIAAIAGAFQQLQIKGNLTSSNTAADLTQYLNYVSYDSTGATSIDGAQTNGSITCNASTYACIRMHNGSAIAFRVDSTFGGTATTNAVFFVVDPDGHVTDGTTNGPGKGMSVFQYYNGRIVDEGNLLPGTANSSTSYSANSAKVPPWFTW